MFYCHIQHQSCLLCQWTLWWRVLNRGKSSWCDHALFGAGIFLSWGSLAWKVSRWGNRYRSLTSWRLTNRPCSVRAAGEVGLLEPATSLSRGGHPNYSAKETGTALEFLPIVEILQLRIQIQTDGSRVQNKRLTGEMTRPNSTVSIERRRSYVLEAFFIGFYPSGRSIVSFYAISIELNKY